MKVLQVAGGYFDSDLYSALFDALAARGIENETFVALPYRRELPKDVPENVMAKPCFSKIDRLLFFPKQRKMVCKLEQDLQLKTFDIIHAHTLFSAGYTARRLYKKYGIPYIVAIRNTDKNVFFKHMIHLRSVGIDIMHDAKNIIFLTDAYREGIIETYAPKRMRKELYNKSLVIPNGIDEFFLLNKGQVKKIDPRNPKLIYIGEITANKNLELTIAAIDILREKQINAELIVVGPIVDEGYNKFLYHTSYIHYFEKGSKEDVMNYLRHSDIFVMPSHTETFGLVYAEAMSQGLPVLYTKGQGFDRQFPNGVVGFAVSDKNARELATRIEEVIHKYEQLSSSCIELVDRFNWRHISAQYHDIYAKNIRG